DQAQYNPTQCKRHGIGNDLVVNRAKTEFAPVKHRSVRTSQQNRACPVSRSQDGHDRPWIVDQRAGEQRDEVELECPRAESHQDHVKAIEWAERYTGADGECQRRSLRRFLKMEHLLEQGLKRGHGFRATVTVLSGNARNWKKAVAVDARPAASYKAPPSP